MRRRCAEVDEATLPEGEKERLEQAHRARMLDITVKQCGRALKDIMAHQVSRCGLVCLKSVIVDLSLSNVKRNIASNG